MYCASVWETYEDYDCCDFRAMGCVAGIRFFSGGTQARFYSIDVIASSWLGSSVTFFHSRINMVSLQTLCKAVFLPYVVQIVTSWILISVLRRFLYHSLTTFVLGPLMKNLCPPPPHRPCSTTLMTLSYEFFMASIRYALGSASNTRHFLPNFRSYVGL